MLLEKGARINVQEKIVETTSRMATAVGKEETFAAATQEGSLEVNVRSELGTLAGGVPTRSCSTLGGCVVAN
jgi:hypothetical protein